MKKILPVLLAAVLLFSLCSCGGRYRIRITGGADLVLSCPKTARAGESVTVETRDVTDGCLKVTVNGVEAEAVQGDLFRFVMPEGNAEVRVLFVGDDLS